jgi:hypothetical protein
MLESRLVSTCLLISSTVRPGRPIFNAVAKRKADLVLKMVANGYLSDPPHVDLYVHTKNWKGEPMIDQDGGLWLFRSFCGSSLLESLHQYLMTSFGHTCAGPWYTDCVLTILWHCYNWRASERNRPNFPKLGNCNECTLDRVKELYEFISGSPKYWDWMHFNDTCVHQSPYGIVLLESQGIGRQPS